MKGCHGLHVMCVFFRYYMPQTNRPRRYRKYDKETLEKAVAAVTSGEMKELKAANMFGVPRPTLRYRLKKRLNKVCVKTHEEVKLETIQ